MKNCHPKSFISRESLLTFLLMESEDRIWGFSVYLHGDVSRHGDQTEYVQERLEPGVVILQQPFKMSVSIECV